MGRFAGGEVALAELYAMLMEKVCEKQLLHT